MSIIARTEAKAQGLTTYFTGKPCKYGHVAARRTDNGCCTQCQRENVELRAKCQKAFHERHPGYAANQSKKRRQEYTPEQRANAQRIRRESAKRNYATAKNWKANNPEKVKAAQARARQIRRETPELSIGHRLRERVRSAVVQQGGTKSKKTMQLIGCDVQYLMNHLQGGFTDGMTWDNMGEWHIDHIIPCSSFDLTDPEQQKQCFHYTNLQPLWAADNLQKSDKLNWGQESVTR